MLKSISLSLALASFISASHVARAAEATQSESETTAVKPEKIDPNSAVNKPAVGGDMDDIITNKKMRAEAGSKSKWSFGSTWVFQGGSIERPLAEDRPNLGNSAGLPKYTALSATVGIAYKLTTVDRLSVDMGLIWYTPFYSSTPAPQNGQTYQKFNAYNPDIMYSHVYRWLDIIQSNFQFGPTFYTQASYRSNGYVTKITAIQNNSIDIGHTGLSFGLYLEADYNIFDKFTDQAKEYSLDYSLEADPYFEYILTDTFNIRGVTNLWVYEHDRTADGPWGFTHNPYIQSLGIGISVTRDIFIYPNVQFTPISFNNIINGDHTNVGIVANINAF